MDLKEKIRDIYDFPQKGIIFRDITTLLKDSEALKYTIDEMQKRLSDFDFDYIVAPESRGFIFGMPIAYNMSKGFIPIRKKGKLPGETISESYELEYGQAEIEIHKDALPKHAKVVIIDDLIATGGTAEAICKLVEKAGGEVVLLQFLIELSSLCGREALKKYNVDSIVSY